MNAVVVLNFGEPESPTPEAVVPFLQRIFMINMRLERLPDRQAAERRARELAEERAPGLIEEYRMIGGSPLNAQARQQADALGESLARRGHDVRVYSAYQFTDPLPAQVVEQARADGATRVVGLPVYPLCGPSTNVAALAQLRGAMERLGWDAPLAEISGWHPHPQYTRLRADAIQRTAARAGMSLDDPRVKLVFSAHGTPLKYLDEGSRYVEYVEQSCRAVSRAAGAADYVIGYQNHTNRPVEWTQPDVERVIEEIDADHVVVDAISFMHEQSETLAELDHELRGEAEERGLGFHRVPIPHDDPRFAELLADLCQPFLQDSDEPRAAAGLPFRACRCRPGASCLNGGSGPGPRGWPVPGHD